MACCLGNVLSCPSAEEAARLLLAAQPSAVACRVHRCTWQLREEEGKTSDNIFFSQTNSWSGVKLCGVNEEKLHSFYACITHQAKDMETNKPDFKNKKGGETFHFPKMATSLMLQL